MIDQINVILREKKKTYKEVNQSWLADRCDMNESHLSMILNGHTKPRIDIVLKIIEALDHDILLVRK